MSLTTFISRAHGYVVSMSDTSCYGMVDEDPDHSAPVPPIQNARKNFMPSRYVLASAGGCLGIAADFEAHMFGAVAPDDDVDACYAAARAFTATINDRAGELYELPNGIPARRLSIDHCSIAVSGFRRDGRTLLILFDTSLDGFQDFDDPDQGEFTMGLPYGVPIEATEPFYSLLEAPSTAVEAFRHLFMNHRELHRAYPERVTRDVLGHVLLWHDGAMPDAVEIDLDATDDEKAVAFDAELGLVEQSLTVVAAPLTRQQ